MISRVAPLVRRVHEREQEHDRDRLARRACFSRRTPRPHRVLVERRAAPRLRSPCARGIGMRARRRAIGGGAGYVGSQISSLWHAAHLDLVAVALGDEQAGRRAVHLDHRVVGGGRAVDEDVELARRTPRAERSNRLGELLRCRSSRPSDWSSSVVGVLSSTTSPSGVTQMRSVNVPPTSTPTR